MKNLRYFLLLLSAVVCGNIFAQKSQEELKQLMQDRNEYYFTFELNGHDDLNAIAQTISVDRIDGQMVTAYANQSDFTKFKKLGYATMLQTPPSMLVEASMWDGSNRAEYDWDSYPTYEAYEAMMYQFATDHPDKCEIITLGTLPSGRKIMIAHINNGTTEGKPKFLYTSTIHGDETTGWMLMLRMIDYILENPTLPECAHVLENIDLYVGPNTNPDGTYHAGNHSVNGATRSNANGVDMNRNYADPNGGPHPDGNEYQTETLWFMQLAEDIPFVMGANYHGGAEVMNYPWDNTYTLHADDAWWQLVSLEYANLCKSVNPYYMSDVVQSGITNGAQWYMIGGGRQDYMNGYAQCREVTIECSSTKLPNANQMPNFWNINKEAIFAYMNQCLFGIHGTVTDAANGQPLNATITITGHDNEFSVVESHLPAGDYHRPIKGGSYTLTFTANGYHPHQETVTVADGETVRLNVQLEAGEGLLPDFSANMTDLALHGCASFTDHTWGANLVSWEWTFEGGDPATSNVQNPTGITYNAIGNYDVTLTVTNANGDTQTVTKHNYIHVSESYNMQNATIETCSALFYDNGGPNGNYGNNLNQTMTFMPGTTGGILEAVFSEFNVENTYDILYIYDGSSTNATLIGQYTGSNSPGTVTATNSEGALTFKFTSDYSASQSGWKATVRCIGTGEPLEIEVSADPVSINEGETTRLSVLASGGDGNYTYRWEPAESLDDPNSDSPIATPVEQETTYKVTVTDGEGNSETGEVTVTIKNWSVSEDGFLPHIYPNPNNGTFTIDLRGDEIEYKLLNSIGQTLLSGKAQGKTQISTSLNQGVYFIQLIGEQGIRTEKIIIEK